jgi:hypothetical protein
MNNNENVESIENNEQESIIDIDDTEELETQRMDSLALESHETEDNSDQFNVTDQTPAWNRGGRFSRYETEKEFMLFEFWLNLQGGRSTTSYRYLSITYNLPEEHILKIATKNCWAKRAAEYDRHQLQLKLQLEQDERAKIHKQKLEDYREQQEFLGRSLSADAAKIAALVSQSLDSMLANNRGLDVRDIPAILNAAAKAAEMGRNLQSSALGVDQLLTALEEYED